MLCSTIKTRCNSFIILNYIDQWPTQKTGLSFRFFSCIVIIVWLSWEFGSLHARVSTNKRMFGQSTMRESKNWTDVSKVAGSIKEYQSSKTCPFPRNSICFENPHLLFWAYSAWFGTKALQERRLDLMHIFGNFNKNRSISFLCFCCPKGVDIQYFGGGGGTPMFPTCRRLCEWVMTDRSDLCKIFELSGILAYPL